jgi:hypothetical protein
MYILEDSADDSRSPELAPSAVLKVPVCSASSELLPIPVLELPPVNAPNAEVPNAEFPADPLNDPSTFEPTPVLVLPGPAAPAPVPSNVLLFESLNCKDSVVVDPENATVLPPDVPVKVKLVDSSGPPVSPVRVTVLPDGAILYHVACCSPFVSMVAIMLAKIHIVASTIFIHNVPGTYPATSSLVGSLFAGITFAGLGAFVPRYDWLRWPPPITLLTAILFLYEIKTPPNVAPAVVPSPKTSSVSAASPVHSTRIEAVSAAVIGASTERVSAKLSEEAARLKTFT